MGSEHRLSPEREQMLVDAYEHRITLTALATEPWTSKIVLWGGQEFGWSSLGIHLARAIIDRRAAEAELEQQIADHETAIREARREAWEDGYED